MGITSLIKMVSKDINITVYKEGYRNPVFEGKREEYLNSNNNSNLKYYDEVSFITTDEYGLIINVKAD